MARRVFAVSVALILVALCAWIVVRSRAMPDAPGRRGEITVEPSNPTPPSSLAPAPVRTRTAAGPTVDVTETVSAIEAVQFRIHVVAASDGAAVADAVVSEASADGRRLGTTDAAGELVASVSKRAGSDRVTIAVRHARYAVTFAYPEPGVTCEVKLDAGGAVHGHVVVGPLNVPVAGALVLVFNVFEDRIGEVTTDIDGRFRIGGAPASGRVMIVARVEGRTTAVRKDVAVGGDDVVIRFADGGTLEGVVTDDRGQPLSGVDVTILKPDRSLPRRTRIPGYTGALREQFDRTTTDTAGRYAIAGCALGEPRVAVAEATPTLIGRSDSVTFQREGERIRRDVRVPAPGSLRVVFEGLARTGIDVGFQLSSPGLSLRIGPGQRPADDVWEFPALTPGRWDAFVGIFGYPFQSRSVELIAGGSAELLISFLAGRAVEGQVVTEDGRPIPMAVVVWKGSTTAVVFAGQDGRFRFEGLDSTPGSLSARVAGSRSVTEPRLGSALAEGVIPGGAPLRLVVSRAGRLRIRLAGLQPGAAVDGDVRTPRSGSNADVTAVGDGYEVVVGGAPGAAVRVALHAAGFAPCVLDAAPLSAGEVRDLGTRTFDAGRTVTLRVIDALDQPVAGAAVVIADWWAREQGATTDAAGMASLTLLPSLAFSVAVTAKARSPYLLRIPAETAGPVLLRLDDEGTLEIRVVARDGSPAARAHILLLPGDEDPFDASPEVGTTDLATDDAGFVSARVQPRVYRLRGQVRFAAAANAGAVVVRPRETTSFELRLP